MNSLRVVQENEPDCLEDYYANVIYTCFEGLEFAVKSEDYTNRGRIGLIIGYQDKLYVFYRI